MTRNKDSRWTALLVLCAGMLMIVLDATIVNVALPSIQSDLHFSQSTLAWVVNGYLITFGGLLLLAGRLGDLLGRRRMFLIGLAVFTTASAACGLAQTQAMLVAARFVQGAGGAMTSAVILGMIVTMFREQQPDDSDEARPLARPDAERASSEQAKAIGVYAFVASAGGSIGLLVGGVLTQAINWHWIFFVNIPIGIVTGVLSRRLLADDAGIGIDQGADVLGAALITSALMLGVYAIVKPAPALGIVAVALLVAFIAREATASSPLMPLRLFRSRNVAGANLIQALSVAGMFGVFFLGALYLRRVLGYSALGIGLAFVPTTLLMGGLSLRYTEKLVTRFGARATLRPGLVLIAAGMLLFARAPVHAAYALDVMPAMVLIGTGCGICFPSLMTLSMSGATASDAGLASGLVNTTVQVGGALGLAVLATVAAHHSHGSTSVAALTGGYHLAFLIGGLLVLASLVVAMSVLESQPGVVKARKTRAEALPAESV